jgi:hypothetical protein
MRFSPIDVSFSASALREMKTFVASVHRGVWGPDLVPIISLAFAVARTNPATGSKTEFGSQFVLGATHLKVYQNRIGLTHLPRIAAVNGMTLLIQLPPDADILDRIDFDWRDGRFVAQN